MNRFDISIGSFSMGKSGYKKRLIMITDEKLDSVTAYKITSKYKNKSSMIQDQYYQIQDLDIAGIKVPKDTSGYDGSFIDIKSKIELNKSWDNFTWEFNILGKLSVRDQVGLEIFVNKYIEKYSSL